MDIEFLLTRADPVTWLLLVVFLVRQGRRVAKLEQLMRALVRGHVAGVQAHRDLALELPKAAEGAQEEAA